ncbi:Exosome complex component RRP41 [Sarcoptes scabiei]|uniref:Putative exosome complex component RRP41 n=1 Tax=Sarcoptes scabiei TaxID=52283 RepID=A0A131ZSH9_SARSC|nr:Exosome complex component RRP41 [Sarcoptes scabiei]KPL93602.1 exosome complex component RRP41-like protein 1 [Sarcoptes scabiei]
MSNLFLLSDSGLRADGRRPNETRKVQCKLGIFDQADGSAYFELGNTRVLAAIYGPHEISESNKSKSIHDRAMINCQYSITTFSRAERKSKPRGDYRSLELNASLNEIFETVIITELYPHSQIDIYLEVLQSDGSDFSACINAASLALIHAGIPMKDIVCSCTAGYHNDIAMIDLNYNEESLFSIPTISLALLPKTKQSVAMESNGRINLNSLEKMIGSVIDGCQEILITMKSVIANYIKELNV